MKLFDVKSSMYIDFDVENNKKDPKFRVDEHVRITQFLLKFTLQIGLEQFSWLKKLKILCLGHII